MASSTNVESPPIAGEGSSNNNVTTTATTATTTTTDTLAIAAAAVAAAAESSPAATAAAATESSPATPAAVNSPGTAEEVTKTSEITPNGRRSKKQKLDSGAGGTAGAGDHRREREEWSDAAIAILLDSYTEKFMALNRSNLRGKDWLVVAELVAESGGGDKQSRKSVEQCKNKIDNLKKRYKLETQRMEINGSASSWIWYKKMDVVFGSVTGTPAKSGGGGGGGGGGGAMTSDDERSVGGASSPHRLRRSARLAPTSTPVRNNSKAATSIKWKRVVFKVSGTALAGSGQSIDPKVALQIAEEVATASRNGVEVAIIIGGRNFFCGDSWVSSTDLDRPTAYQIGVTTKLKIILTSTSSNVTSSVGYPVKAKDPLRSRVNVRNVRSGFELLIAFNLKPIHEFMMATVMNSVLLQSALEKLGIQTRVQSAFLMPEIAEPYNRLRAMRHLDKGRVVIFGGVGAGTGNPLFTTDTAAALRASEINADAVIKGTNVNGIFDKHKVLLDQMSFRDAISKGSAAMDLMAIQFCEENAIPVVLFNMLEPGNVAKALTGKQVGTLID
ncbi:hypothetical protein OSB04_025806 [Centaurea solstitialis]|uniref:UMP kinase n=1 Tax=Centaurea solstitialis TaxID=347529 RepID=A0AA38SQD4_9ASTR|nr:hypothetical protein OSB04_025806 [Centaurea solstitialis]